MSYLATDAAGVVTAVATSLLVVTAALAYRAARDDIKTQRKLSRDQIETLIKTSSAEIKASQKNARDAQRQAERDMQAHIKTSADAIKASQKNARNAQEVAERDIEAHIETSAEALRATFRPLLIDVHEHTSEDSDLDPDNGPELHFHGTDGKLLHTIPKADWRLVHVGFTKDRIHVAVPLRNVGTGPALVDIGGVRLVGLKDPTGRDIHRERVPPNETTRLLCTHKFSDADRDALRELHMQVLYRDLTEGNPTKVDVQLRREGDDEAERDPDGVLSSNWHVRSIQLVRGRGARGSRS